MYIQASIDLVVELFRRSESFASKDSSSCMLTVAGGEAGESEAVPVTQNDRANPVKDDKTESGIVASFKALKLVCTQCI